MSLGGQCGRWLAAAVDNEILFYEIGEDSLSEPRIVGRVDDGVAHIVVDPLGRFVATADAEGGIRLWSLVEAITANRSGGTTGNPVSQDDSRRLPSRSGHPPGTCGIGTRGSGPFQKTSRGSSAGLISVELSGVIGDGIPSGERWRGGVPI